MPKIIKDLPESLKNAINEQSDQKIVQELDPFIAEYGKEAFLDFYPKCTLTFYDNVDNDYTGHLLYTACQGNMPLFAERLLSYGISPNETTRSTHKSVNNGITPLIAAAASGHEKIVKLLLTYDANLLITSTENQTALMWSSTENILLLILQQAKEKNCFEDLIKIRDTGNLSAFEIVLKNTKLSVFKKMMEINNWATYANLPQLLHVARLKSLNKPKYFKDYDNLCSFLRNKLIFPGHRLVKFPEDALSTSIIKCHKELFGYSYKCNENPTFSSKTEAMEYVIAQAYSLLQTPEDTFKYLRFLNAELKRYYKETYQKPFPKLNETTYTFKVIDGTLYPIPNDQFSQVNIHKYKALHNVLIALFKKHQLAKEAFLWIGFINEKIADEMAKNGDFFEESIYGGLFHGILSHMLQRVILIYAAQKNQIKRKFLINGQLEEISIEEMIAAFITLKEYKQGDKVWFATLDRRHFFDISFSDPHRIISVIMHDGKKYGLSVLADSLIHSFCQGYLKSLNAYKHIIPDLKDSPEEFAEKLNELWSPLFDPPKKLVDYAIKKQQEKKLQQGITESDAIIGEKYAVFPLKFFNYLHFKPKAYDDQHEYKFLKKLITFPDPNPNNADLLKNAIKNGEIDKVTFFLQNGITPNQTSGAPHPLALALHNSREEIACLLLEYGSDPNIIVSPQIERILICLIKSCDYTAQSPISVALMNHPQIDINAVDKYGNTALFHAVCENKMDWIQSLLKRSANTNIGRFANDGTPLFYAVQKNNAELVDLLITHHADVNKGIKVKKNYLINISFTIDRNKLQTVLKEHNEFIEDFTPLQIAVLLGQEKIVTQLLTAGADIEMNANGIDVIELANRLNHENIQTLLHQHQKNNILSPNNSSRKI